MSKIEGNPGVVVEESITEDTATTTTPPGVDTEDAEIKDDSSNKFSKQFAALSRKEKALREREKSIQEMEARLKEAEGNQSPAKEPEPAELGIEELIQSKPLEALQKAGFSVDDILQMIAGEGEIPEHIQKSRKEQALEAKIAELESKLDNRFEELEKNAVEKEHAKVVDSFKDELKGFIDSDEAYEFIRFNEAYDTVYEVIQEHYNETGKLLTEKEAADAVEEHLEEEAMKFTKLKKLQSKLGLKSEEENSDLNEDRISTPSMTLDNDMTATPSSNDPLKGLSVEERLERLAQGLTFD